MLLGMGLVECWGLRLVKRLMVKESLLKDEVRMLKEEKTS